MDQMVKATKRSEKELKKIARQDRDFLKHAERDPDAVLENFTDERNDYILISATIDYKQLARTKPIEIQVFQMWFFALYPDMLPLPEGKLIRDAAQHGFPGIASLPRAKQKAAGVTVMNNTLRNPAIMNDPSTDRNPVCSLSE
jgi:hypothetical protein